MIDLAAGFGPEGADQCALLPVDVDQCELRQKRDNYFCRKSPKSFPRDDCR